MASEDHLEDMLRRSVEARRRARLRRRGPYRKAALALKKRPSR